MKSHRRGLGSSTKEHNTESESKLRAMHYTVRQGLRYIERNQCIYALDAVHHAADEYGAARAHAGKTAINREDVREAARAVGKLVTEFRKHCVRDTKDV